MALFDFIFAAFFVLILTVAQETCIKILVAYVIELRKTLVYSYICHIHS